VPTLAREMTIETRRTPTSGGDAPPFWASKRAREWHKRAASSSDIRFAAVVSVVHPTGDRHPHAGHCESAFWKKAAIAPAAPATTMIADNSSAMSSARPAGVIGFFNWEETVSSWTVVKKNA
jgi:hypothetical protein